MNIAGVPAQPTEETWTFIADLQSPLWTSHAWTARDAARGEADLRGGVRIVRGFLDPDLLLETAYADLSDFLAAGPVREDGAFVIETGRVRMAVTEAYRIEITDSRCRILAGDTEGIRRGLFHVEDMMLRAGGPFLPLGVVERKPFIQSRISRCFFGPINRPPKNRDELMDDVDYYPDQYLNRLAHEGINGLWLSVEFRDLCRTSVAPEFGNHVERRMAKLRKTVNKCRRHGIRVYLYANEPHVWSADDPVLQRHPELGSLWAEIPGHRLFCPFSDAAQQYLYEATHGIFTAVPGLGGLINISHGERYTTCLSSVSASENGRPICPVCSKKANWEVLHATLSPMARGIHDAQPQADFIAWLYMPNEADLGDWVYELPKHFPENVTLQFNFESGVVKEVFGKGRTGGDYWISTPGPSARFERVACASRTHGVAVSAKIQTGCSHEVATAPFVPVPGLLYRKFRAMRELGVTRVMLCWYFGNYPGLMNKAAGELSFEPFPETEDAFLRQLAGIEWGKQAETVAQAWRQFAEGYGHFPVTNNFQYYGPMHDGVVWPLLLRPEDTPLTPTWLISQYGNRGPYPPSGDRIGEALGESHTLAEAIELCRAMSDGWEAGLASLRSIEASPAVAARQRLDVGVAEALGVQFRSGLNILRFYNLRERMIGAQQSDRLAMLDEMRRVIDAELENDAELLELCRRDSRLGFHSEAEGYKYFPEKILWRMNQLRELLQTEVPSLRTAIERGDSLFPEYSGAAPTGPCARSRFRADMERVVKDAPECLNDEAEWWSCTPPDGGAADGRETLWTCRHDRQALYFLFRCAEPDRAAASQSVIVKVEPRRLWPCLTFYAGAGGAGMQRTNTGWQGWIRIPFVTLGERAAQGKPLRVNVLRTVPAGQPGSEPGERAWIRRHPWPGRLIFGCDNPADLGWLFFQD